MASVPHVAAFTDTYLPTVNGVTYTIRTWRERWGERGGRMDVVYPGSAEYGGEAGEFSVPSLPFPFYEDFRLGAPAIPDAVRESEVVHAHTPFGVGLGGLKLARAEGRPLVASYHTPTSEYAGYLVEGWLRGVVARVGDAYERWFLRRADRVVAPSETARKALRDRGIGPVSVVPNGVDIDRFAPVESGEFRARYDLPESPLVGYTGRHGYEKQLSDLLVAAAEVDATFVFGGDGPARESLEAWAEELGVDARFLGFLDREELPEFYSALDVFAFPSPIETQGLVALEAMACGTPVVGVASGALIDTIVEGETGYHYPPGDTDAFEAALRRALAERDRLREVCLARREVVSVERAIDELEAVYEEVR
jgi:glycosyltransferase involved in cell wall biosynthesis